MAKKGGWSGLMHVNGSGWMNRSAYCFAGESVQTIAVFLVAKREITTNKKGGRS